MWEFLLSVAANGLGGIASNVALARMSSKEPRLLTPLQPLNLTGEQTQGVFRRLLALDVKESELDALQEFFDGPEGLTLARFVAVETLARRDPNSSSLMIGHAQSLLSLSPATRLIDAPRFAGALVDALRRATDTSFRRLASTDRESASQLSAVAVHEYRSLAADSAKASDVSAALAQFDPTRLVDQLTQYASALEAKYRFLSVPSLHEERRLPFDSLYVHPKTQVKLLGPAEPTREYDLSNALEKSSRLIVLGQPGGGKSTILGATVRRLTLDFLSDPRGPVPLVVSLAAYSKAKDARKDLGILDHLTDRIASHYAIDIDGPGIRYLLASGKATVFYDGLDEVLQVHDRAAVRDDIEMLAERFPGASHIVSSRSIGYAEAPFNHTRFTQVDVLPFDAEQISDFAAKFFPAATPDAEEVNATALVTEFMHETEKTESLRSNPLMLGLLCLLYQSGRTIPGNRAELYRVCAEMLFSKWDARRGFTVPMENSDTAEGAVMSIAYDIFYDGLDEVSEIWLREKLCDFFALERGSNRAAAERFATEVIAVWRGRRWLLVDAGMRDGEHHLRFSHRTMLEYFAAQQASYISDSGADLWHQIAPYVSGRAGIVHCQLAVELFSKKSKGNGEDILGVLSGELRRLAGRARWNLASFVAEVLPSLRAQADARREAIRLVVGVVVDLVPLHDVFPLLEDSEVGVFEFSSPEDRAHDATSLDLPYGQVTVPLETMLAGSNTQFAAVSEVVEEFLLERLRAGDTPVDAARAAKLCIELESFPHLRDWVRLSPEKVSIFNGWALAARSSLFADQASVARVIGLDFWLDIYLSRLGLVSMSTLFSRHGMGALICGGWGNGVSQGVRAGTPLHYWFEVCVSGKASDARRAQADLHGLEKALRDIVVGPVDHQAYDEEMFTDRDVPCNGDWQASLFKASAESRACILALGLALVRLGSASFFADIPVGSMSGHARTLATAVIYGFSSPLDDPVEAEVDDDGWWEARDRAAEAFEAELTRFTGGDVKLNDLVDRVAQEQQIRRLTSTRQITSGN